MEPIDAFALWDETVRLPLPGELERPAKAIDVLVHRADEKYQFLHDNAAVWHGNTLFAGWYNCPQGEMEGSSCIRARRSRDGGRTWSNVEIIAADDKGEGILYVPVTFLSHGGRLLAFVSNMVGLDLVTRCEVFALDEANRRWRSHGCIAGPFLPNCAPLRMTDGHFIMAGRMADQPAAKPETPAVLISASADPAGRWDTVPMMTGTSRPHTAFPESTIWLDGPVITAVVRGGLVFTSRDYGRNWTGPFRHNLPAEDSKLYAVNLSTGQRCLVWNYPDPEQRRRNLLAVAVSRPGEKKLVAMWQIRHGYSEELQAGPEWSYPYAVEHADALYVIYTSEKKHSVLTIIPLHSLAT